MAPFNPARQWPVPLCQRRYDGPHYHLSACIDGAWGRPGGGLLAGVSTGSALDTSLITRDDFRSKPTRQVNINKLGHALTERILPLLWGSMFYHCNPAGVVPDQNKVLQAWRCENLFTVVHERL